jgi:hypothetical protein
MLRRLHRSFTSNCTRRRKAVQHGLLDAPSSPMATAPNAAASALLGFLSMTRTLIISCMTAMSMLWVRLFSRLPTLSMALSEP